MKFRKLGKTDHMLSEIGLGCMSLPVDDEKEAIRLIHLAMDAGINVLDTADLYQQGKNEELVGKAIQDRRDAVFLCTKVGNEWKPDGSWSWNPRKEYIVKAIKQSLRRLKTDHIDLYQMHGGTMEDPLDESLEAMTLLQSEGLIRHYGISSIRPTVIQWWVKNANLASVMVQYSLLDRRPEEQILPLLAKEEVGILLRGTLAQGLLVDKPAKDYLERNAEMVSFVQEKIRKVAGSVSPEMVALNFVLKRPEVDVAMVGVRTEKQLKGMLASLEYKLSAEDYMTLKEAAPAYPYKQHRI
ncbi:MAG TPA: aldo/keto reductase [Saprospiraceae bacterium]|nr:aldo/keto reductase [Saprospiraceae bacterium]